MDGGEKKEVRRPMNAFLIFCKRHRGFVREKNPDMDNRSVTRVLGDLWANLGEEKKIYTNLAKQYKDAFMKANPNYKWHSSDKSQSSSSKMMGKPTNSRVIKSVAEIPTDGSIIPGKLADPEKMGGLSLLLMADKETGEGRSFSSSLTSTASLPLTIAAVSSSSSSSAAVVQNTVKSAEHLSSSSSALLQLAEMCTSELQFSAKDKPKPATVTGSSSLSLITSALSCQQPMPPPKKRARHWSLTEGESLSDPTNYIGHTDLITGSLSPQNLSLQKFRCTSVGSAPSSDDKYMVVDKYKPVSSRRRLSSSTTESVPSPLPPFADGLDSADSPVFSPDVVKSENFTYFSETKFRSHEIYSEGHERLSQCSEMSERSPEFMSTVITDKVQLVREEQPVYQKLLQQPTVKPGPHPLNIAVSGVLHPVFVQERQESSANDLHSPHTSGPDLIIPSCAVPSPDGISRQGPDIRSGNGNLDFYMWREPGKIKVRTGEKSPGSLKLKMSSDAARTYPSPQFRKKHCGRDAAGNNFQPPGSARSEPTANTKTAAASSALPLDTRPGMNACSVAPAAVTFTSVLSKERIASRLGNSDDPVLRLPTHFSDTSHSECTPFKIISQPKEFSGSAANEIKTFIYRTNEQNSPALKLNSAGMNKSDIVHLQAPEMKLVEPRSLCVRQSCPDQSQTFSERKLKKKWTERMLTETRLKEDLTQQQMEVEGKGEDIRKGSLFDIEQSCSRGADSNSVLIHAEPKMEVPKVKSSDDSEALSTKLFHHSGDLKLFSGHESQGQSTNEAQFILDYSLGSLNAVKYGSGCSKLFGVQGHPKLMQQLSQSKESQAKSQTFFNEVKIKSEQEISNFSSTFQDENLNNSGQQLHMDGRKAVGNLSWIKSEEFTDKQVVNQIVEQLCKSGFSADNQQSEATLPGSNMDCKVSANERLFSIEMTPGCRKTEISVDGAKEIILMENPEKKVYGSSPCKDEQISCGDVEQGTKDWNHPCLKETELQGQGSNVSPESCDHSDVREDSSVQPLRKSRRANRGQKYQELIKEGFIQPCRERLAARNAENHGRSFESREEFEKVDIRRTLKRSASERDSQSAVSGSNVCCISIDDPTERRFASGDFDLEKEIESLPVCSLDQLDKKKMRRRCDSDTLGLSPRHRNSGDATATALSSQVSSGSAHGKLPLPLSASAEPTFEVDLSGPCCPAPHIPLPKVDRPAEPVTGSRKRKARKHVITRISVVDEKTPVTEIPGQKCNGSLPYPVMQRKVCSLSRESSRSVVSDNCEGIVETAKIVMQAQKIAKTKLDSQRHGGFSLDGSKKKVAYMGSLTGNSEMEGTDSCRESTLKAVSASRDGGVDLSKPGASVMSSLLPSLPCKSYESKPATVTSFGSAKKKKKKKMMSTSSVSSPQNEVAVAGVSEANSVLKASLTACVKGQTLPASADLPIIASPKVAIKFVGRTVSVGHTTSSASASKHEKAPGKLMVPPAHHSKESHILTSRKELPKKCSERKQKRITGSKTHLKTSDADKKPWTDFKKFQGSWQRQCISEREGCHALLASALPRHSDSSYINETAEAKESEVVSRSKFESDGEKGILASCNVNIVESSKDGDGIALQNPIVSVDCNVTFKLKNELARPIFQQHQDKSVPFEEVSKDTTSLSVLTPVDTTSATGTVTPQSETIAAAKSGTSLLYKPHQSTLLSSPLTTTFPGSDTVKLKLLHPSSDEAAFMQCSESTSQVQPYHVSSAAIHNNLTFTSVPSTCASLHNSLLNQLPSSGLSSSIICTSNSTFCSTASPLLSLTPPLSSPSTSLAALSASPVISLATSTPSTKSEIVSYTVIGSSSVMEAGSPHMIGSPHLPESPSLAIVQS